MSKLRGQAKTLRIHIVLWAAPCPLTLTAIPKSFEEVFMGTMPFLSPNNSIKVQNEKL